MTMKMRGERLWSIMEGLKPIVMMVVVQVAFAGVNIFYKLAANDGMNLRILVAYRFLFAVAFIVPFAFFLERKGRPKLTWMVLGQAFVSGLIGGSLVQNLYLEGLALTSATFASALANLVPAMTYLLALSCGLERLAFTSSSGKAKMAGTVMGIGGAMLMTLYKGVEIKLWSTDFHIMKHGLLVNHSHDGNRVLGALLSIGSSLSYASWLILQAKMSDKYPPYSSTALMTVMGSIQAIAFALCAERDWNQWKLGWNVRLLSVAYSGIVGSGVMVALIAWCVRMRGPLFVSIFNPLVLILVAIVGSFILDEKLFLGSVLGALLIICGLYAVLWGKAKEMKRANRLIPSNDSQEIEIVTSSTVHVGQSKGNSVSNLHQSTPLR
ncbi:hypothetical protein Ancab_021912 [Ancistrocladus abbreviatus]